MSLSAFENRSKLLSLMQDVLEDELDFDLFERASKQWLECIKDSSVDPSWFLTGEREFCKRWDLSQLEYRFLFNHIANGTANSLNRHFCVGIVFHIPKSNNYKPVICIDEETSLLLASHIRTICNFDGEINISKSAAVLTVGSEDLIPYDFLIAMEKSMNGESRCVDLEMFSFKQPMALRVFVMANMSVGFDVSNGEQILKRNFEMLKAQRRSMSVKFKELSDVYGVGAYVDESISPLGGSVWGEGLKKLGELVRGAEAEGRDVQVRFEVKDDESFLELLPMTKVQAYVSTDGMQEGSVKIAATSCPAMAIGWTVFELRRQYSQRCQISSD